MTSSAKPLRLLHMVGAAKPGGAETFALRLFASLHRHPDVELKIAARKGGWLALELKKAGIPVEEFAFGGMMDMTTAKGVRALAREFQPDLVTSWMNRATRFVPKGPWATLGRLGGYYDLKYYRGKVEFLAGNTQDICDYCLKSGWDGEKIVYIPNFVPEPQPGWKEKRADVRESLGIGPADTVLLQAGRLHANKAVDVALKALAQLPETTHLLLAGEGPLKAELETLAQTLGVANRVHWLGWVAEISKFAAATDIWLAPSRFEPLGNIVLDAWMHGIPVVAAKSAGPASLITDGKNGLMVEIDDDKGLATAIRSLTSNPEKAATLGAAGLDSGRTLFGEDKIVARTLETYRHLIELTATEGKTAA